MTVSGDSEPTITAGTTEIGATASESGAHEALPTGTRVDEFRIDGLIGQGGFGIVYLAHDESLHRMVALKEYMPLELAERNGATTVRVRSQRHAATFDAGLRSFINEARLLAQFDHPSLVKVHRFFMANGTAYMAMPYYKGVTLKQTVLEVSGEPEEAWIRALISQLLDALQILHSHSCYHRDISPDNILMLEDGRPLLLDFGAARRVIGGRTRAFTVILKPGYAPIEQYAEDPDMKQGPWTDLYAFASVMYFALTRRVPVPSIGRVVNDRLVPLSQSVSGRYSDALVRALDAAMSLKPQDRPQSVEDFRAMLAPVDPVATSDTWAGSAQEAADSSARAGSPAPLARTADLRVEMVSTPRPLEHDRNVSVAPVADVPQTGGHALRGGGRSRETLAHIGFAAAGILAVGALVVIGIELGTSENDVGPRSRKEEPRVEASIAPAPEQAQKAVTIPSEPPRPAPPAMGSNLAVDQPAANASRTAPSKPPPAASDAVRPRERTAASAASKPVSQNAQKAAAAPPQPSTASPPPAPAPVMSQSSTPLPVDPPVPAAAPPQPIAVPAYKADAAEPAKPPAVPSYKTAPPVEVATRQPSAPPPTSNRAEPVFAQKSAVGNYVGSFRASGGPSLPIGLAINITSDDNGRVSGTAKNYSRNCAGDYVFTGTLRGSELVLRSTTKAGMFGDCGFGFRGTLDGNRIEGAMGNTSASLYKR
jgi:serine/threonine protein kinase